MMKNLPLESFESSWSKFYEQESTRVLKVLGHCTEGGLIWRMAHVGSTALSNVPAQSCIDILLDVYPVPLKKRNAMALEALGYQPFAHSSLHNCEVFVRCDAGSSLTYRLFVTTVEFGHWANMLVLRDYLNENIDKATEYATLKLEYMGEPSYETVKLAFFVSVLPLAYHWHIKTTGFQTVIELAEELSELEVPWHISSGWALDLFLNKASRYHDDIDLNVERQHQLELQSLLLKKGWTVHFIEDARSLVWKQGSMLPSHSYQVHARKGKQFIDILVEPNANQDWLYRRDERIKLDKKRAVLYWQKIPFLAPEAVLLFKAKIRGESPREKDSEDFRRLLPYLSKNQKSWLKRGIQLETADHPWLFNL